MKERQKWSDLSYVIRSPLSARILVALRDKELMPVEIAKKTGIDKSNVSTKLIGLINRGMVECLNPQDRKGRFYHITEHGKKMLEEIDRRTRE